jgi:hypothetical protein
MNDSDVRAAANTPIKEVYSELRDRAGQYKTSAIIIGSLLLKAQEDKSYKENGYKSLNELINSLGLSVEAGLQLMKICETLKEKFPDAYEQLKEGTDGAYLPGKKAMIIADKVEINDQNKSDFLSPTGIKKLEKHVNKDKIETSEEIPIEKLVKSSKIFTKKVLNCDELTDSVKAEMAAVDKKIQDAKQC